MTKITGLSNSKFSRLIQGALYIEDYDLIKLLYKIEPHVTEDLHILFEDDMELMEIIIRELVKLDQTFGVLDGRFTLLNCPPDRVEYMTWFIKLFAHLESLNDEEKCLLEPEDEHYDVINSKYSPFMFDIDNMKFYYQSVEVDISTSPE